MPLLPCDKGPGISVHDMGGEFCCKTAVDMLIARAISYRHPCSLKFSGQWLLQTLGTTKAAAMSLKLLFVNKLLSSTLTALDLGVSRVAKGICWSYYIKLQEEKKRNLEDICGAKTTSVISK